MLWRKDCVTSEKNASAWEATSLGNQGAMWSDCDDPVRYLKGAPPPAPPTHCNPSEGRKVVCNQREYSPYDCSAFFQTSLASLKLCLTKTLFVFSKRTKIKVSQFASAITRNRRRPFGTSRDINLSWKAASQLSVNLLNGQAVLNLVVNLLFISTFFYLLPRANVQVSLHDYP